MIFEKRCRKSTLKKYSFFIDNDPIEISQEYSQLGLCRRCIFATKSFLDFQKLSIDTCNKLFNTLLKSILLYSSEVWGAYDKRRNFDKWQQDPVERLPCNFTNTFLDKRKKLPMLSP